VTETRQRLAWKARTVAYSPRVPFEIRCRLRYLESRRSWATRRPETFAQKLTWKLAKDRRPLLTTFADKVAVRDYVADAVGPEVLTELYAVVSDPRSLDPARLPAEFVVKPNHASGLVWIVSDRVPPVDELSGSSGPPSPGLVRTTRAALDWDQLVSSCDRWLATDYSDVAQEWAYRHIPRRILVEELLADRDGSVPRDYKFLVFHGRVRLIEVHTNRFDGHRVDLRLPDWEVVDATLPCPAAEQPPPRPEILEKMVHIAETLGQETDFVRVDLYDVDGRIVFGELTSSPGGLAAAAYYPDSLELGRHWTLPGRYQSGAPSPDRARGRTMEASGAR
jgi:hypothetical protein